MRYINLFKNFLCRNSESGSIMRSTGSLPRLYWRLGTVNCENFCRSHQSHVRTCRSLLGLIGAPGWKLQSWSYSHLFITSPRPIRTCRTFQNLSGLVLQWMISIAHGMQPRRCNFCDTKLSIRINSLICPTTEMQDKKDELWSNVVNLWLR